MPTKLHLYSVVVVIMIKWTEKGMKNHTNTHLLIVVQIFPTLKKKFSSMIHSNTLSHTKKWRHCKACTSGNFFKFNFFIFIQIEQFFSEIIKKERRKENDCKHNRIWIKSTNGVPQGVSYMYSVLCILL